MTTRKDIDMARPIAVLYGGTSAERAVSLVSGQAVADALMKLQVPHEMVDQTGDWIGALKKLNPQMVFIALHGGDGENGTVQAVLDTLKLPYNGSGVLASALAMDKVKSKALFAFHGIDVPAGEYFAPGRSPSTAEGLTKIKLPVVVKPAAQGSSVGVSIVRTAADWSKAVKLADQYGQTVMVEEFIPGHELTVALLDGKALAVTEILADKGVFYDYDSKYAAGGSRHVVPAQIPADVTESCLRVSEQAYAALGAAGAARVDLRYDPASGRVVVLELNTLPGMTGTSLLPEQARYTGYSFEMLIKKLVEDALCQNRSVA